MIFRQIAKGPCKTYLIASPKTKEAVLVDPLLERAEADSALLKAEGLRLTAVIDTHTHADHLSAGTFLRDKASVPYLMHQSTRVSTATRKVADNETLGLGDVRLRFLHTPGHTTDSLTLALEDRILSGDFLFIGSGAAGRLDLPGSDPGVHYDNLRKLDALPDHFLLNPAHDYQGAEQSTLGAERKTNPVLAPRDREAYVRWWLDKKFGPADWMKDVVRANMAGTQDPNAVRIPAGVAACACAPADVPAQGAALPQISPEDLAEKVRRAPGSVVLLDVRTPEEFNDELGHIAGAVLIPVDELAARTAEVPQGPVAVICRSGKRATRAALLLRDSGRGELWVMTGGMLAWNERRLPLAT